jgi:hypothetical protein
MATTLLLAGSSESIDFVAGADFRLLDGGLLLPPPDPVRVSGGSPLLSDGQQLIERRYDNRAISITFKTVSPTHDALSAAFSRLQRILDHAVRAERSRGMLAGATLTLKLEQLTDPVTFDVLDGDIEMGAPLTVLSRRQGPILENTLTLVARPYARGTVVRLDNYIVNGDFETGRQNSMDDDIHWIDYEAGERHFRATTDLLVPAGKPNFAVGAWVTELPSTGGERIVIKGGNAYELAWIPLEKKFAFRLAGGPKQDIVLQTGDYVGDGIDGRPIPWTSQARVVVTGGNGVDTEPVVRTDLMAASQSMNNAVDSGDYIGPLTDTHFIVNSLVSGSASANKSSVPYYWWALSGDSVITGSYTGDDAATQVIDSVGFPPEMVWVVPDPQDNLETIFSSKAFPSDSAVGFGNKAVISDAIVSLDSDGFTVGDGTHQTVTKAYNKAGRTYHYVAFKKSSTMNVGSYVGSGGFDNILTGLNPDLVVTKGDSASAGAWRTDRIIDPTSGLSKLMATGVLESLNIFDLSANPGFFTVGISANVNDSGVDYYYMAFSRQPTNDWVEAKGLVEIDDSLPHHVAGLSNEYGSGTSVFRNLMLMQDGHVVAVASHSEEFVRDTSGEFSIGARLANSGNLTGELATPFVILRNMWPWEARMLYLYGHDSLIRGTTGDRTGTPPGSEYWDLSDVEYGAYWPFKGGSGAEQGPHNLTLSQDGTPDVLTAVHIAPEGWALGATLSVSTGSRIRPGDARFGRFHQRFKRGSSISTFYIEEVISIPEELRGREWTLTFYAQTFTPGENSLSVFLDGDVSSPEIDQTITAIPEAWTQYGRAVDVASNDTQLTVRFGFTSGAGATDVGIDGIQLMPGNPFALSQTLGILGKTVPTISSRFCRTLSGGTGKDSRVTVYDLPGDSPLPTRVLIKAP